MDEKTLQYVTLAFAGLIAAYVVYSSITNSTKLKEIADEQKTQNARLAKIEGNFVHASKAEGENEGVNLKWSDKDAKYE